MANSIYSVQAYNASLSYMKHDVVLVNTIHYYALTNVPPSTSPPNDNYWGGRIVYQGVNKPNWLWKPSYGSPINHAPRVKSLQFGDGYEQRVRDGINNTLLQYDIRFEVRTYQEAFAILHFLDERAGSESFVWTPPPPYASQKLFICKDWTHQELFRDNHTINGRFLERPN